MENSQIIEYEFNKLTKSKLVHEAILLIENTKGDFRIEKGYGGRSAHSPMLTASVAKLFVTVCILIFKEQGKLKLDDKLTVYFKDDILKGLHTFKGHDYSYDLKLSDLLFHKSGLPCWYQTGGIHQQIMEGDFEFPFEKQIASTKSRDAVFAPSSGKAYYSDINFNLLGKVLEIISGKHISEIYQEYIFKHLELNKTNLLTEDSTIPVWLKDKQIHRPKFLASHGEQAVITTADELMIFIKAFFNEQLFDAKVFEELSVYTKLQLYLHPISSGGGYWKIPLGGIATFFKGTGELLGHAGSTGSFAFYYPHKDLYFVGDINQAGAYGGLSIGRVVKLATKLKKDWA